VLVNVVVTAANPNPIELPNPEISHHGAIDIERNAGRPWRLGDVLGHDARGSHNALVRIPRSIDDHLEVDAG